MKEYQKKIGKRYLFEGCEKPETVVYFLKMSKGADLMNDRTLNMTAGKPLSLIVSFALPLMLGNVFQQLYNMVDTWVVGRFVSNEAYAAVGSVGPIVNMLVGFFMGLSSGAGVVISQYYGAKRMEDVQRTVHTTVTMTFILGILFTAIGLGMTPFMLRMMNTPENVLPESTA